jgi:hypothetical protein
MELSAKKKYSFPVIVGMNSGEPLSTRAARMKIYNELVREIDSSGGHYSQDLSEVDLSDGEDVKVLTNDPDGEVLVHLGSSNYLDRFKIYVAHLREWRQQFEKLESVDLRYDRQIIVNPDLRVSPRQPAISASAAKAAISAGVKPAALVTREPIKSASPHVIAIPSSSSLHSTKKPRVWEARHKHAPSPKHIATRIATSKTAVNKIATKTVAKNRVQSNPVQSAAATQKPSPSTAKGQGNR